MLYTPVVLKRTKKRDLLHKYSSKFDRVKKLCASQTIPQQGFP